MIRKVQIFAFLLIFCLSMGMASHAVIVVDAPGFGSDVIIRGSGALPSGYVEVFVNGV